MTGNRLLDALPDSEFAGFEGHLEGKVLSTGEGTHEHGERMSYVDFPIDALLSVVVVMRSGAQVEVESVGREGYVEIDAGLEALHAPRTSYCRIAGRVLRAPLDVFRDSMHRSPRFARLVRRNVSARFFSAGQNVACKAKHSIEQQLSRWLLQSRDRVDASSFRVTHESMSEALGVRRATVTTAASSLEQHGAVLFTHGRVTIPDVAKLESMSCECYFAARSVIVQSFSDDPIVGDYAEGPPG